MRPREGWLATILELVAVIGALAMVVRWCDHTGPAWDVSLDRRYTIPAEARAFVRALSQPVRLVAFVRSGIHDPAGLAVWLPHLARESPAIQVEFLDIDREPTRARQYGVDTAPALVVVGPRRQRVLPMPQLPVALSYIAAVTRTAVPQVYACASGEHDSGSYARLTAMLESEGFAVAWRRFPDASGVPPVRLGETFVTDPLAASPTNRAPVAWLVFDPGDSDVPNLEALVRRGASLLLALEPSSCPAAPRLCTWLAERLGIRLGAGVLLDARNHMVAGDPYTILVPGLAADHPITASLARPVLLSQATTVELAGGEVRGWTLLYSGRSARLEPQTAGASQLEEGGTGPFPLAVARVTDSGARVVVIGDADFATDRFLDYGGNRDFLVNAANWLVQEGAWFVARPPLRPEGVEVFFLSAGEAERLFWAFAVAEPILLAACGLVVWWRRGRH